MERWGRGTLKKVHPTTLTAQVDAQPMVLVAAQYDTARGLPTNLHSVLVTQVG